MILEEYAFRHTLFSFMTENCNRLQKSSLNRDYKMIEKPKEL